MVISDLIELLIDMTVVEVYSLTKEENIYKGYSDDLLYEDIVDYYVESIEVGSFDEEPKLIINVA